MEINRKWPDALDMADVRSRSVLGLTLKVLAGVRGGS
jgi:hypothetical protein